MVKLQVLSQSKILGEDIQEKQKVAEVTEGIIDSTRSGYVPVATLASILYFCVSGMFHQSSASHPVQHFCL